MMVAGGPVVDIMTKKYWVQFLLKPILLRGPSINPIRPLPQKDMNGQKSSWGNKRHKQGQYGDIKWKGWVLLLGSSTTSKNRPSQQNTLSICYW